MFLLKHSQDWRARSYLRWVSEYMWSGGFPSQLPFETFEYAWTIYNFLKAEIKGLQDQMMNKGLSTIEAELLREQIRSLRDRNLRQSAFEEKADLVAKLGLKILPTEDLKSRKIYCRLNLAQVNKGREQYGFTKATFGGPFWTRTRDPSLIRTVL